MKIFATCMQCQFDLERPSFEAFIADYFDDGSACIEYSEGHKTAMMMQSLEFEMLLDSGATALLEGFTLEACGRRSDCSSRVIIFNYLFLPVRATPPTELNPMETTPMSNPPPDPAAAPTKPPYPLPPASLREMVLTLGRPPADAPEGAWQEVVQTGLDRLGALDPRDPIEAMLAIQIIAAHAGSADACRLAFEPGATAAEARRQRASAATLNRGVAAAMRLLQQQRALPLAPVRDWGDAAVELAAVWRAEPPRPAEAPRGGKLGEAEPAVIVRWIDELTDAEVAIAVEEERREEAGEPPLPRVGPKVLYRYKPNDYIHKFKPDERAARPYPGWENMTKPERREFFGYTYKGEVAPLSMLTPASQAAAAAGEE